MKLRARGDYDWYRLDGVELSADEVEEYRAELHAKGVEIVSDEKYEEIELSIRMSKFEFMRNLRK